MPATDIVIKGAREHNLRSVDLVLPRNQLICLTGVSGSGKSSLAFDTLYAEGQRRYVESLSSFARQFLGQMPKPEVDYIAGLSPSISISQKAAGINPRSTVGTITEIYDYLRVLFARVGTGFCPKCSRQITAQSREQIIERILSLPPGTSFMVLAPLIRGQKGEYRDLFEDLLKQGFVRARTDGTIVQLNEDLRLDRQMRHNIEVVVDRLKIPSSSRAAPLRPRLAEAVELALKLGDGNLIVAFEESDVSALPEAIAEVAELTAPTAASNADDSAEDPGFDDSGLDADDQLAEFEFQRQAVAAQTQEFALSAHYACTHCGLSFEPPSPQLFSFNSPQGMCKSCDGLGEIYSFEPELLVEFPSISFKKGCISLVGLWSELGRWRRHIYQGVAETLEKKLDLPEGTLLETPWKELSSELQNLLLYGTGDEHITYTWRKGRTKQKYGGQYEGIIPQLLSRYRSSNNPVQRRQLEKYMNVVGCAECHGARLNPQSRSVRIQSLHPRFSEHTQRSLPEVCRLSITDAVDFFSDLQLDTTSQAIAAEALKEIRGRLGFLVNVGLSYLTLDRTAPTLSGGESQRIRLAGQIGCGLVGVLYILDEPSIGLHPRDNDRLLETLTQLRDKGNTVVVVEHDEDTMLAADHLIDFGPGPGVRGGEIVAQGPAGAIAREKRSLTGQYLAGDLRVEVPEQRRVIGEQKLSIIGATHNNLKNISVDIPLGGLVCVTGVSGSGKSSLINDILVEALRRDLNGGLGNPGLHERIEGLEHLDKLIAIDQSPIGRTPRSNPSTYIKVFDDIRTLFTQLPESKTRGYKPGRFSFNVSEGRCEACEGNGSNKLEMDFLADVWVTCPICNGQRFNRETLQVRFKGKNIAEVLDMDVQQALAHFENIPNIRHKLQTLHDVGLDYLKLGQPSPTLSGGEAQRIKLARELVKKSTGKTLYLLDEPTTGLHFADIQVMLKVLHDFADAGNTVLVVEHNLDVVKTADWIIDIGPEGGLGGGEVIGVGTPEDIAAIAHSHTGRALAPLLKPRRRSFNDSGHENGKSRPKPVVQTKSIILRGAGQHNLKQVDVEIPRDKMTVCCGLSGSGKSSLAMDTIYAEGQRRYVESLSSYARQFVGQMPKPKYEHIEGLSPAIAIEQKHMGHTPRSTVGTVTEIYDYFRVLMARLGRPYCPACDIPIGTQTTDEIIEKIMAEPEGTRLYLMAPLEVKVGEKYENLWEDIRARGYPRMRIDGKTFSLDTPPTIDRRRKHLVEVVVDRVIVRPDGRSRVAESIEAALSLGKGLLHIAYPVEDVDEPKWRTEIHNQHFACDQCGRSFEQLTPHNFSFNSALGWCGSCEGLGTQTGANPAALLGDTKLTLAEGAIIAWPNVAAPLFKSMLTALSKESGLPIDVPFDQLNARQRRVLLYGLEDQWITVYPPGRKTKKTLPLFRFQYKGLYPALEEAARLSPAMRGKLEHMVDQVECSTCGGSRLRDDASAMRFQNHTIDQIGRLPLGTLLDRIRDWHLEGSEQKIAGELIREISARLEFLCDVGLEYLSLNRPAPTLSGGESQRIRLASQIGSGLCGVLYVLDEPTIGLHPRDNRRLIKAIEKLRDLGNTLLVVEHDREVVEAADQLLDFGPAAGIFGGEIVARGTPAQVGRSRNSVTGPYLSGKKGIVIPNNRRLTRSDTPQAEDSSSAAPSGVMTPAMRRSRRILEKAQPKLPAGRSLPPAGIHPPGGWLGIMGARHNNLRNIDVYLPLGVLTAVTGPSGSGKSSLVEDVLYQSLAKTLHRASAIPGAHEAITGLHQINKVIRVDQQSLGNTPTSNPATYTGAFELIRTLFSQLPEAKVRGFSPRRFSFNAPGGRCEDCEGNGQKCIEMHFLPNVWVECATCRGERYNPETLAVKFHGHSISDVLNLSCRDAAKLFHNIPKIRRILQTLCDVGLDYLTLGQPAPTLSGGEAQRVKLAAELARPDTGKTLYLLDEPTTGLHFDDIAKLLEVLNRLVDLGNTVVVIEHNLDVIKTADWLIDMGPEAGDQGGQVVVSGTPEEVAAYAQRALADTSGKLLPSHTGEVLAETLSAGPYGKREFFDFEAANRRLEGDVDISDIGKNAQMPWEENGEKWHTIDRVSRTGAACRWDGEILRRVVEKIQELGDFAETNWNARGVVEVRAHHKSDGWFLHAMTSEEWLLKLKFRVARSTFKRTDLVDRIGLAKLNDLTNLPIYGDEPRVSCKNLRGPWQEIQLQVHTLSEVDTPEFWKFLEEAVSGFSRFTQRAQQDPESIMPWRVLGQKWHFSRKGFPPGRRIHWELETLEELCELVRETADGPEFLWNNQQVIHLFTPGQSEAWASIFTKRVEAIDLVLNGPKESATLGRIANLGFARELDDSRPHRVQVKIKFRDREDLARGDLASFLQEHFASVTNSSVS